MKYRINFSIPDTNFNLVAYDPSIFIKCIPKKDGKQLFTEWYIEYEDGLTQSFVETSIIEKVAIWIKDKIIVEPEWADKIHGEAEKYNCEYFAFARQIVDMDLSVVNNQKLFELYRDLREFQVKTHSHAIATTWFLDSDREVYSDYLREELKKYLITLAITDKTKQVEYFTILTTPHKESFATHEQIEFLQLLKKIKESGDQVKDFEEDIKDHYQKWHWVPYGYIGPAYTLDYYENKIKQELQTENISELLVVEKGRSQKVKKERDELISKIKLPAGLKHFFDIACDIIWLKDYRKYCLWHGHYVLDLLTKEIAKRVHISHKQANHLLVEEVKKALFDGEVDENLINERIKYTLIYCTEEENKYYYGDEARKIRVKLEVEDIEVDLLQGFRGTCACPGEVEGRVKIVNSVTDIDKVKAGDIMLAHTTYPSMLPAMKRAGAIVSEDGGITCHAAIVSREFRIPCVVGVKKITEILKDGDRVFVDATEGVVKKIS